MRSFLLIAAFAAFVSPAQAASFGGPLEPAAQGKLQCSAPNVERKTCAALSAYRTGENGGLEVVTSMLVAPKPLVIMETTSAVEIKDGRVCGIFKLRDIANADFTSDGKPLGEQHTYFLRDKLEAALERFANREVCSAYLTQGVVIKAKSTLDGVDQPKFDQVFIWVSPQEGYKVGGPN